MLLCIKDDSFLVETDKTLMENTLKLGTKGFLAGEFIFRYIALGLNDVFKTILINNFQEW